MWNGWMPVNGYYIEMPIYGINKILIIYMPIYMI